MVPSGRRRRGVVVIGRSVLRFRQFDLRSLPVSDQRAALRAQLAAWQPFPDAEYFIQWRAGLALVHACAAATLEGLEPQQAYFPESSLHPAQQEGLRLVSALEGFEAQYWSEGLLRASRWWAEAPGPADWIGFVRAAGISGEVETMPAPQALPWAVPRPRPVTLAQFGQTQIGALTAVVAAGLLGLTGFTGFAVHDYVAAREAMEAQRVTLMTLREQTRPVVEARARALTLQTRLAELLSPLSSAQPVEVLDHLMRVLPSGVLLRELDLQGLELRVLLEPPANVARSQLIEALQAGGWLVNIAEVSGARVGIVLQMKLKGTRSPDATLGELGTDRKSTDKPRAGDLPAPPPFAGGKP